MMFDPSPLSAQEAEDALANAECLFEANEVLAAVDLMAEKINRVIDSKPLMVMCVMNGGMVTTGLLLPKIKGPARLGYVHVTRYGDDVAGSHNVHWRTPPSIGLKGENILLVDDIFDEGLTLQTLYQHCLEAGAHCVTSAVLVSKQHVRKPSDFQPDYIGLEVPDRYVFGMGMDYKGWLRNVPGIYALMDEPS